MAVGCAQELGKELLSDPFQDWLVEVGMMSRWPESARQQVFDLKPDYHLTPSEGRLLQYLTTDANFGYYRLKADVMCEITDEEKDLVGYLGRINSLVWRLKKKLTRPDLLGNFGRSPTGDSLVKKITVGARNLCLPDTELILVNLLWLNQGRVVSREEVDIELGRYFSQDQDWTQLRLGIKRSRDRIPSGSLVSIINNRSCGYRLQIRNSQS